MIQFINMLYKKTIKTYLSYFVNPTRSTLWMCVWGKTNSCCGFMFRHSTTIHLKWLLSFSYKRRSCH